jgi:hypothetical protein
MMRFGQAKHDERIVQQAFLDAFPNPERIGCPGDDVIRAIARKKIDSDESVRRHMRRCSPCSQDLLTSRHQWRTVKITRFAVLAAAATVLIVFGIYWRQTISHSPSPQSNLIAGNHQPLNLETGTLDFYDSGIRRGTGNAAPGPVQTVRSSARLLVVILPMASLPGEYEVQIRNGSDDGKTIKVVRATASNKANGRTALQFDLGAPLLPGSYGAAFRPQGSNLWSYGTFTVQ